MFSDYYFALKLISWSRYPEDEEYDIEGHRNQTLIGAQESLEHYNNEKVIIALFFPLEVLVFYAFSLLLFVFLLSFVNHA